MNEGRFLRQRKLLKFLTTQANNVNKNYYEKLSKNTINLARKIVKNNKLSIHNLLSRATKLADNKVKSSAITIQRKFRKTRKPMTNENYIRKMGKLEPGEIPPQRLVNYAKPNNVNNALNKIYTKRHNGIKPKVKIIKRTFKRFKNRRIAYITNLLNDMKADGRFEYYGSVLYKLFYHSMRILRYLNNNYTNKSPKTIITETIGVCHYNVNRETPRVYLKSMIERLVYVAKEYQKINHKKYFDRLFSELGDRPCLENLLDSMIEALVGPVFVWEGKGSTALIGLNNSKYLNKIMTKAVITWKLPKNTPEILNVRKRLFWNQVKNRTILYANNVNTIPYNMRVLNYNKNGKKFKESALANTLEYKEYIKNNV